MGYETSDVPEYRQVHAELKARNRFRGLIPILAEGEEMQEAMQQLNAIPIRQPIGSIVDLLQSGDGRYLIEIPPQLKALLIRMQNSYTKLEPVQTVSRNQFAAILDAVRTNILDWSLQLEANGVLGEGMTFSAEEKQRAQSSITIQNFQGIIGDVSGSTVTQNLQMSIRKGDFASLRAYLSEQGVNAEDIDELQRAIDTDSMHASSELFGAKVSAWMGKMVSKAATGAWQIGIGAAGGLLGNALKAYYGL